MDSAAQARNVANLVNLSTPLGMLVARLCRARIRVVDGLVVADRARVPAAVNASAITIGSVVLVPGSTLEDTEARIPELLAHEANHAYQYSYCFGLPFLPLYAVATAWSWLRTGDRASANHFEVQAGLRLGGYTSHPRRPLRDGVAALLRRDARR